MEEKENYCVDCVFYKKDAYYNLEYCYFDNWSKYKHVTKKIKKTEFCERKLCTEKRGAYCGNCHAYKRKWWKFWVPR